MYHTTNVSQDLPHAVLDILPDPVFIMDADRKVVWVNAAFETFIGLTSDEVAGRRDLFLVPTRRTDDHGCDDLMVLRTGTPTETRQTVFTAAGDARDTLIRKSRLILGNGNKYIVGLMSDLTEVMRETAALIKDKTKLERQTERLKELANTDPLTGALNRRALTDRVAATEAPGYGLLYIDIDHFKAINDTYGHAIGDDALVHFCDIVRGHLRATDTLARIGGEEFVVMVPRLRRAELGDLAHRICNAVRAAPLVLGDGAEPPTVPMTVSIGAAVADASLNGATTPFDEVLYTADGNVYRAKTEGRDQVILPD